ncbi:MAG TPA: C2H2-type zinc finger protein [Nitrososphaera sp.]|nr:C2H2-type zinc finger protein [Nitrososphaera sp.]
MSVSAWYRKSAVCEECGRSFYSKEELDRHYERQHFQHTISPS